MLKKVIVAALILVMGLAVSVAAGEKGKTTDVKTDKTTVRSVVDNKDIERKKTAIMKVMNNGQFKAHIQDDKKFCAAFLEDFKAQKNIEHIKPIVEVDDYNNPKLQDYFKRCPKGEYNKNSLIHHARTFEEQEEMDKVVHEKELALGRALTEEEKEDVLELRIDSYATKNFKLYKVDIDNNAKNGDEVVFYADGYKTVNDYYLAYGYYKIIDLEKCKVESATATPDPYGYDKPQLIDNYSGIIKYGGEYYVFSLFKDPVYILGLEKFLYSKKYWHSICGYRMQNTK